MVIIFVIIRIIPKRIVRFIITDSSLSFILVALDARCNIHCAALPAIVLINDIEINGMWMS